MPRDNFVETIASIAADGTLKAIGNVEVTVKYADSGSTATIYENRTGATEKSNPFLTGSDGMARFWGEEEEYTIEFSDTQAPARIADVSIGWVAGRGNAVATEEFVVGDIKIHAGSADHDRWLRMDGREMTQAEVESALSLDAGDGAAILAFLGTGTSSKYGDAASGKIKLADTRRRMWMGAGTASDTTPTPVAGLSARPLKGTGSSGGVETVTLTSSQSGIREHKHGDGTLSGASHQHGVGSLAVANHSHGATGLTTVGAVADNEDGLQMARSGTNLDHHRHAIAGNTDPTSPGMSGSTASVSPDVTGSTGTETSVTTSGSSAASSHDNMSPFVTLGYCYIRV